MPKGFGDGSKLYQKRAKQALALLVAQAKAENTITYGLLAREMDMSNPRNLNNVLGAIGDELKNLSHRWREKIPPVNCLVVNKHNRTPQRGIGFLESAVGGMLLPKIAERMLKIFRSKEGKDS